MKTDLDLAPEELPWECVLESKPTIGEVPVWSGEENSMYWIDVYNGLLNRTNVGRQQGRGATAGFSGLSAELHCLWLPRPASRLPHLLTPSFGRATFART